MPIFKSGVWPNLVSVSFALLISSLMPEVALGQKINTGAIGESKDQFSLGPVNTNIGPFQGARFSPDKAILQFATGTAPVEAPLRDTSVTQDQKAIIPDDEHCDNQGDIIKGATFLCEVFYAVVPQDAGNTSEKEFTARDPLTVNVGGAIVRFWALGFMYVVSSRQMNGDFGQVVDKFSFEVRDKDNKLRERWEPKLSPEYEDPKTKTKVVPTRVPRWDGQQVYSFQARIRKTKKDKFTAMAMIDIASTPQKVSTKPEKAPAKGVTPRNRLFPDGVELNKDDVIIRVTEFIAYARVDCNNDDAIDKWIYRIDLGFELKETVGETASKADLKVTEKKRGTVAIASRIKISKFPALDDVDGRKPAQLASKNDPGDNPGWELKPGTVEKTGP